MFLFYYYSMCSQINNSLRKFCFEILKKALMYAEEL